MKTGKLDVQLASHGEAVYGAYTAMGLPVAAGDITVSKGKLLLFNRYEISDASKPEFVLDTLKGNEKAYARMVPELMDRSVRERMTAAHDALKAAGLSAGPIHLWRAVQLQAYGLPVEKKTVDNYKAHKATIAAAEKRDEVETTKFLWNLPAHALGNLKARLKERVLNDFLEQARKNGMDPIADHELAVESYRFVLNSRGEAAWKLALRSPTILSPMSVLLGFSSLGVKTYYKLKEALVSSWTEDIVTYSQPSHVEEVQRTEMVPAPVTQEKVTAGFWVADSSAAGGHYENREVAVNVYNSCDVPNTGDIKHVLFIDKDSLGVLPTGTARMYSGDEPATIGFEHGAHSQLTDGIVRMPDGSEALVATSDRIVFAKNLDFPGQPTPGHLNTGSYDLFVYQPNSGQEPPKDAATLWPNAEIKHTYTEQVTVYGPAEPHHEYKEHHVTQSTIEAHKEWFVEHWDRLVASFVIPIAVVGITTGYRKWNAFAMRYLESDGFKDDLAAKMVGQMETF